MSVVSVSGDSSTANLINKSLHEWLEITVNDPERRNVNMKESYVTYSLETRVIDSCMPKYGEAPTNCWRRYSEFELLRSYLESFYPNIIIPPLPDKKASQMCARSCSSSSSSDKMEVDFIERRRMGLEKFLVRIAKHKILSMDKIFFCFLFEDSVVWKKRLAACDYKNKVDWKSLTSSMMSSMLMMKKKIHDDGRLDREQIYCNDTINYLNNIIKIRMKILNSEHQVHCYHGEYGKVMSEWWVVEDGDGWQAAGHYLDAYSQNIEPYLEEEDVIMDSLNEYLGYTESLRKVCYKEEVMMMNNEQMEECLKGKETHKNNILQTRGSGGSGGGGTLKGMKERIFGCESNEEREARLKCLEDDIQISKDLLHVFKQDTKNSYETAIEDIDRFHAEKVIDISQILLKLTLLQIEKSKKNVTVWQNIKESFHKL